MSSIFGFCNLFFSFVAIYYFAAFTGRDIIIADNSIIGEMCRIITCGFPFASEISLAYPDKLSPEKLRSSPTVKTKDMQNYMEGKIQYEADVITGFGYQSTSDWWVYFNATVRCVQKITGCDAGDVPCADRHAYQRLIRGPFKAALTAQEESRIFGVPQHMKHAILTLPHAYAPRLDAAIHVRSQFQGFEDLKSIDDPEYKKEVQDWLASEEAQMVINSINSKIREVMMETRKLQNCSLTEPVYVYLASDNEDVKLNFTAILEAPNAEMNITVMRVRTDFIQHVKNLDEMKKATNNQGMLDLVFDWYALSLSNMVFAWRKGSTNLVSTFVHSSQRVSGTTERSDPNAPIGHGIGTMGYQLQKSRRGVTWAKMWIYTFLEDFV